MKEEQKEVAVEEPNPLLKMGKRTPLHKQKAVGIKEKPGFFRYQVVEHPGEVEKFMLGGYRPCQGKDLDLRDSRVQHDSQLGEVVRQVVNRNTIGMATTAIWMEIPIEDYRSDQLEQQRDYNEQVKAWSPKGKMKEDPNFINGSLKILDKG